MAADTPITTSLCEANRKAFSVELEGIADDAKEARKGVGKLLRIICEGNGREPMMTQVDRNTEFRERVEREGTVSRHRLDRWWIAVGGWGLTLVGLIWMIVRTSPTPPAA